jgi:hypothetical protein
LALIELVSASPVHVGPIATRMRHADRIECAAMGHSPKQALRAGILSSSICLTATVDGRPEAMLGLVVTNALCGRGSPWMLGTEAIYDHPREMIRWGPGLVAAMADSTRELSNLVSADNLRAIRMLRRWGFDIGTETIVLRGTEFLAFSMECR